MVMDFNLQGIIQLKNEQSLFLLSDIHELSREEMNGNTK